MKFVLATNEHVLVYLPLSLALLISYTLAGCQVPQASHEEKITREISEIQKIHGTDLPPYKYRLWAEMIVSIFLFVF